MKNHPNRTQYTRCSLLLPLLFVASACMAKVGAEDVSVPPDAASTCAGQCESIGLRLGAVAIMANTVGCVCALPNSSMKQAGLDEGSAITAGMATIVMQQAARQQQQQQQQQQVNAVQ